MNQASASGETSDRKFSRSGSWMPTRRWTLISLGIGGVVAGLALGWDWVVAAGLAPLVISVLPCAAMCALGMCAMRSGQKPRHGESESARIANAGEISQSPSRTHGTGQQRPEIQS